MTSPISERPPRPRRRLGPVPRFSKDPEVRSVQVGVLATVLVHLLLFVLAPLMLSNEFDGSMRPVPRSNPDPFSIELAPDAFPKEKDKPEQFVETNPDAPENIPDKTTNFGAQNQQVAQEMPTPDSKSDRPAIEGEKDVQSTQIVDGQLRQPQLPHDVVPPPAEQAPAEQADAARREQNPLSGFEKNMGDNAQGTGSNIAAVTPNAEAVPEKVEGAKDAPIVEGATSQRMQIDPRKPQPRQVLTKNVRPAVFQENKVGTMNIGAVAYDARWNNYGQYLQKMIEAIQLRWDDLITASRLYPQQGSTVTIAFVINSAGKIESISAVDSSADKLATGWCVSAVSPNEGFSYGPWTDDMVAMLGSTQELKFNFLYR